MPTQRASYYGLTILTLLLLLLGNSPVTAAPVPVSIHAEAEEPPPPAGAPVAPGDDTHVATMPRPTTTTSDTTDPSGDLSELNWLKPHPYARDLIWSISGTQVRLGLPVELISSPGSINWYAAVERWATYARVDRAPDTGTRRWTPGSTSSATDGTDGTLQPYEDLTYVSVNPYNSDIIFVWEFRGSIPPTQTEAYYYFDLNYNDYLVYLYCTESRGWEWEVDARDASFDWNSASYEDIVSASVNELGDGQLRFEMTTASTIPTTPSSGDGAPWFNWTLDVDNDTDTGQAPDGDDMNVVVRYNPQSSGWEGVLREWNGNYYEDLRSLSFARAGSTVSAVASISDLGLSSTFRWAAGTMVVVRPAGQEFFSRVDRAPDSGWVEMSLAPDASAIVLGTASVIFRDCHDRYHYREVPLGRATVSLVRNGAVVSTTTSLHNGSYRLEVDSPNAADSYRVRVALVDNEHVPPVFRVRYAAASGSPVVYAQTPTFTLGTTGGSIIKNVNFSSSTVETDPAIDKSHLPSLAVIYYHSRQVVDFITGSPPTGLGVALNYRLPVDIYAYEDAGDLRYSESDSSIHIPTDKADSRSGDRPMNREWHEMFHHLMKDTIGIPERRGCNHGGYLNTNTADSWAEGWAEAWATILQDHLGYPHKETSDLYHYGYCGNNRSWEYNYRVWDAASSRYPLCESNMRSFEEYAVASLIWDLYDRVDPSDIEQDWIDLTTQQLWNVLTSESIENIRDLYLSLERQSIGAGDSDADGLTDLDEIFIMHGFFADGGNRLYDGEEVGWGGKPGRRDVPHIPGAAVEVDLVDKNGDPLNCVTGRCPSLWLEIEFGPPNEYFSYAYEVALSQGSDNLIGLALPPTRTVASVNIRLSTGGQLSETFTMDNQAFWSAVATTQDDHIAEVALSYSHELHLPLLMRN